MAYSRAMERMVGSHGPAKGWVVAVREKGSHSGPVPALPRGVESAMGLSSSPPVHFLDVTSSYLGLYTPSMC